MARVTGKERPEEDRASGDPDGAVQQCLLVNWIDLALEVPTEAKPTESALAGFDDRAVRESASQSISLRTEKNGITLAQTITTIKTCRAVDGAAGLKRGAIQDRFGRGDPKKIVRCF